MKVLSLFDGISCGKVALDNLGVDCEYMTSEVDPKAITIAHMNHHDNILLGDVTKLTLKDIPFVPDLILGGPPCQDLSSSSWTRTGLDGERSGLYEHYLRILNEVRTVNPDVLFLMENVKMKDIYRNKISGDLGVEPVFINSADYTAQSRQRYYWFNWDFKPSEPKDIHLQDVIDSGFVNRKKSYCIDAGYGRSSNPRRYAMGSRQIVFETEADMEYFLEHKKNTKSTDINFRILTPEEVEKLQGLSVGYTNYVAKFWRYHGAGNGWTVPVIEDILRSVL